MLIWIREIDQDVAFAGLLSILESERRYQYQDIAGELLDKANIPCPLSLGDFMRKVLPLWNLSAATVPRYAARVFGRALGARDVAMGLGALTALRRQAAEPGPACAWVIAGALSDALDVVATLSSWRELPRTGRWLVAASAGGAALAGVGGALALRHGSPATPPGC